MLHGRPTAIPQVLKDYFQSLKSSATLFCSQPKQTSPGSGDRLGPDLL